MEQEQLKYVKKQYHLAILSTVVSFIALGFVVVTLLMFVPKVYEVIGTTNDLVPKVDTLMDNTNKLVEKSEESVEEAMEKLNKIDFDTLNQAIVQLERVIRPVSEFFNIFN